MVKITKKFAYISLLTLICLIINGCGTLNFLKGSNDKFTMNIRAEATANQGEPMTVIVMQPIDKGQFVGSSYGTLSAMALTNNLHRYIVQPGNNVNKKIEITATAKPLAVFFVLQRMPTTTQWKYYFATPQGKTVNFILKNNTVSKE